MYRVRRPTTALCLFAGFLLAHSTSVAAQVTTYTDRTLFTNAITAAHTQDFSGLTPLETGLLYYEGVGTGHAQIGSLNFSSPDGTDMFVLNYPDDPFTYRGTGAIGDISAFGNGRAAGTTVSITITLPNAVTAFGLDLGSSFSDLGQLEPREVSSGIAFAISLSNGTATAFTSSTNTSTLDFFGLTSPDAFSSVTLSANAAPISSGESALFDNITYGDVVSTQGTVTPEPATLVLLATGFAGIAGVTRRKRRSAVTARA